MDSLRCARVTSLPNLTDQARRLIALGVPGISGKSLTCLRDVAGGGDEDGVLLVVNPDLAPASTLAPLVEVNGKKGFVVTDMVDVDEFESVVPLPDSGLYLVSGLDRGDEMANWSPDEALPAITASGRTPLTLTEGLHWLLQQPSVLERNACFMTVASRRPKPGGRLDARTPAIWLSNGNGRDGRDNRDAPKVGWCWAGNRHTWLGFASGSGRRPVDGSPLRRTARASGPARR